jgi:23S rRNA (uracil1939-C5)-methyltransferase
LFPGAVPGDTVITEIIELKQNYARGKLLEIISPSPKRTVRHAPFFRTAGGAQQVEYREQLSLKTGWSGTACGALPG